MRQITSSRLMPYATPLLAVALSWGMVLIPLGIRMRDHAEKEVSTGIYEGMMHALRQDPSLAGAMLKTMGDGLIDNREAKGLIDLISDRSGEFLVPDADHSNPVAQTAARNRLVRFIYGVNTPSGNKASGR